MEVVKQADAKGIQSQDWPGFTLVTGASGGIGFHMARTLILRGHRNIFCHYHKNGTDLKKFLKQNDLDPNRHCASADLTNEQEATHLIESAITKLGPCWALLNVVGANRNAISWKMSLEDFKKVIDLNLSVTFLMSKLMLPHFRTNKAGRIVNVSSVVAATGAVGACAYAAAKSGIEGLSRSLALEVSSHGIAVNTLSLGYFEYGLIRDVPVEMIETIKLKTPAQRLGSEWDLYSAARFLCDPESQFMTGQVIRLNGGYHFQ